MATYDIQRYLLMTTDPVHIGTGGYRLGRVDNSIVREPGTRIPKIPGSSLHGAARSYAARLYENIAAAGKDHRNVAHPGTDPVCYTFGYVKEDAGPVGEADKKSEAYSGVVNVCDAHVALFPVHSMCGPVWVSTVERMKESGFKISDVPGTMDTGDALFSWSREVPINIGWIMVGAGGKVGVDAPPKWKGERWEAVRERIVLINEPLFSHIVNSNLEVRTSVSIDPMRGAAEDGALFTYEALPRSTFLYMDAIMDDYRDSFPGGNRLEEWLKRAMPEDEPVTLSGDGVHLEEQGWKGDGPKKTFQKYERLGLTWSEPGDVLKAGLQMIEWLGVGGMGTRGFGRISIVGEPLKKSYPEEEWQ